MAKKKAKKINHDEMLERNRSIKSLQSSVKALENEIEENKRVIKDMMTEFKLEEYEVDVFTCTYKDVSSTKLDSARLKSERPDLYEKYLTETTGKRFVIA